jgi:Kef-type K+ transport system membrane component KefB/voltage-gated potassium channel Kch
MTPVLAATAPLPIDLTALLLVLGAAWAGGALAIRMGYPAVLGELLAGIVLGPPLFGLLSSGEGLAAVGELGIVLMMLYIGTEIDLDDLRRASRAGVYAAIGGFVLPFVLGAGLILVVFDDWIAAIFVGSAMGVTSLATKSRILSDLRLFDTRIAYVLVAGALLSDTATLVVFAGVLSLAGGEFGLASTATVLAEALAFFVIVAVLGRTLLPWLGRRMVRPDTDGAAAGLMLFVGAGLGAGGLAEVFGLHPILGSFVAGMFLRRSVPERTGREVAHLLERLSIGVLAPVFFVTAGFAISLSAAVDQWPLLLAVVALATIGKVLGTAVAYLPTGHGWREGTVIGAAMNGRGAVEIIVAGIGLEAGLITQEVFTVLVLMAIITTALVPVMLTRGVQWLRDRGELHETPRRRGVTIVGAGPVSRHLARALRGGRPIRLVDTNEGRCAHARADGHDVVHGDALDPEVLRAAHTGEAGLLVTLTTNFEVNLLVGRLAHEEFGVPEIRVAVPPDRVAGSRELLTRVPSTPLIDGGVDLLAWEQALRDDEAAPTTVVVVDQDEGARLLARLRDGAAGLPLAVARGDDVLPFGIVDDLRVGDRVTSLVRRVPAPVVSPAG